MTYTAGTVKVHVPGSTGCTFHAGNGDPDVAIAAMYQYAAHYRTIYGHDAVEILIHVPEPHR